MPQEIDFSEEQIKEENSSGVNVESKIIEISGELAVTEDDVLLFDEEEIKTVISQMEKDDDLIAFLNDSEIDLSLFAANDQQTMIDMYLSTHQIVRTDTLALLEKRGMDSNIIFKSLIDNYTSVFLEECDYIDFVLELNESNRTKLVSYIVSDQFLEGKTKVFFLNMLLELDAFNDDADLIILDDNEILYALLDSQYSNSFISHLSLQNKNLLVNIVLQEDTDISKKVSYLLKMIEGGISSNTIFSSIRRISDNQLLISLLDAELSEVFITGLSNINKDILALFLIDEDALSYDQKTVMLGNLLKICDFNDNVDSSIISDSSLLFSILTSEYESQFMSQLSDSNKKIIYEYLIFDSDNTNEEKIDVYITLVESGVDPNLIFSSIKSNSDILLIIDLIEHEDSDVFFRGLTNASKLELLNTIISSSAINSNRKIELFDLLLKHGVLNDSLDLRIINNNQLLFEYLYSSYGSSFAAHLSDSNKTRVANIVLKSSNTNVLKSTYLSRLLENGLDPNSIFSSLRNDYRNLLKAILQSNSCLTFMHGLSEENKRSLVNYIISQMDNDASYLSLLLDTGFSSNDIFNEMRNDYYVFRRLVNSDASSKFLSGLGLNNKYEAVQRILRGEDAYWYNDSYRIADITKIILSGLDPNEISSMLLNYSYVLYGIIDGSAGSYYISGLTNLNKQILAETVISNSRFDSTQKKGYLNKILANTENPDILSPTVTKFIEAGNSSYALTALSYGMSYDILSQYIFSSIRRGDLEVMHSALDYGIDSNDILESAKNVPNSIIRLLDEDSYARKLIQGLNESNKKILVNIVSIYGKVPNFITLSKCNIESNLIYDSISLRMLLSLCKDRGSDDFISGLTDGRKEALAKAIITSNDAKNIKLSTLNKILSYGLEYDSIFDELVQYDMVFSVLRGIYKDDFVSSLNGSNADTLLKIVATRGNTDDVYFLLSHGMDANIVIENIEDSRFIIELLDKFSPNYSIALSKESQKKIASKIATATISDDKKEDALLKLLDNGIKVEALIEAESVVNFVSERAPQLAFLALEYGLDLEVVKPFVIAKIARGNISLLLDSLNAGITSDEIFERAKESSEAMLSILNSRSSYRFIRTLSEENKDILISIVADYGDIEDVKTLLSSSLNPNTIISSLDDNGLIVELVELYFDGRISINYPLTDESLKKIASSIVSHTYYDKAWDLYRMLDSGVDANLIAESLVDFISSECPWFSLYARHFGLDSDLVMPLIYGFISEGDVDVIALSLAYGFDSNDIILRAKENPSSILAILRDDEFSPFLFDGLTEEGKGMLSSIVALNGTIDDIYILYDFGIDENIILSSISSNELIIDVLDSFDYPIKNIVLNEENQIKVAEAIVASNYSSSNKAEAIDALIYYGVDPLLISSSIFSVVDQYPEFAFYALDYGIDENVIIPLILEAIEEDIYLADTALSYGIDPDSVLDALLESNTPDSIYHAISLARYDFDYNKIAKKGIDLEIPLEDLVSCAISYYNMPFIKSLLSISDISSLNTDLQKELYNIMLYTDDIDLACLIISSGLSFDLYRWNLSRYILDGLDDRIILSMIEKGADVNINSPMTAAAKRSSAKVVKALYENGADPDYYSFNRKDQNGPLYYAILREDPQVLKAFVSIGANLNIGEKNKNAAYIAAMYAEKGETIEILNEGGASFAWKDYDGKTPLMYASINNPNYSVIRAIANSDGVSVEERDNFGKTALIYAAESGTSEAVLALLNSFADPMVKDSEGNSVFDYARFNMKLSGTEAYRRLLSYYR